MATNRAYERERKRRQRARLAARRAGLETGPARGRGPGRHTQRFLAIDGEGGNRDGIHHYTLLVAAGKNHRTHVHNNGEQLTPEQCLDFILGLPKQRKLIAFYFNYDITMMLKGLPRDIIAELIDREGRTNDAGKTVPAYFNNYRLDWIPGKLFKVARGTESRTVYDTAGFFQSSLVAALDGWKIGTEEEQGFIERMKAERSVFTTDVTREVIEYAYTECVLLTKLMDAVYRESESLGFHLRTFSGAGSLANAMLEKWGVHNMIGYLPSEVSDAAWHAYFGGRFEVAAVGEITGPIYEADINSAYPAAMQHLPCLHCGTWTRNEGTGPEGLERGSNQVRLYRVEWDSPMGSGSYEDRSAAWGPFPWRSSSGSICYPMQGAGWYWHPEVEAAARSPFANDTRILESWTYTTTCEHHPFGHVPELYERRKQLKKEGHLGEKVIKLGINSLYGKTAQSVGSRKFASPVWAGIITSSARAQCFDAINQSGNGATPGVVMVATDAVYSTTPIDLDTGEELGQWETGTRDNMLIVQPGLYALDVGTGKQAIRKTRGIRKTSFGAETVLTIWREAIARGGVEAAIHASFKAPATSFVGLRRGMISLEHNPGEWVQEHRTIGFEPKSKRVGAAPIVTDRAVYLPSFDRDGYHHGMSGRYSAAVLTETEQVDRLLRADDGATPTPDMDPSRIPGFEDPDKP